MGRGSRALDSLPGALLVAGRGSRVLESLLEALLEPLLEAFLQALLEALRTGCAKLCIACLSEACLRVALCMFSQQGVFVRVLHSVRVY